MNGVATATYSEGLQVGYRWYDAQDIKPLFPFGFGLYTTFSLSRLETAPAVTDGTTPSIRANSGWNTRTGKAEVPSCNALASRPQPVTAKAARRLQKVWLDPGDGRR